MPAKNGNLDAGPSFAPSAQTEVGPGPNAPAGAILVADDNPDDALYSKKIIEKLRLPSPVHVVLGGEQVFAYLEGQGPYQSRIAYPYPILLLLDLRMPTVDGFEVLKWLQARPEHRHLPVVVLSVVRDVPLVSRAYQLGARTFLIKPLALDEFKRTLQALSIVPDLDASTAESKPASAVLPPPAESGPPNPSGNPTQT